MGVRENKVERYLRDQIRLMGGDTRKWVSPGHDGVPDQICMVRGDILFFCEVKTVDGMLSDAQIREHVRLRGLGAAVCTVCGNRGVDLLIKDIQLNIQPLEKSYE